MPVKKSKTAAKRKGTVRAMSKLQMKIAKGGIGSQSTGAGAGKIKFSEF